MTITHSCCPAKRDIYAPTFTETEVLKLAKGLLSSYECKGCKTVIMVYEPYEDQ